MLFSPPRRSANVSGLEGKALLCCTNGKECQLCLQILVQLQATTKDSRSTDKSVMVCYRVAPNIHSECKTLLIKTASENVPGNRMCLMVESNLLSFGHQVTVYINQFQHAIDVIIPSVDEVCSSHLWEFVKDCKVPVLRYDINNSKGVVELWVEEEKLHPPELRTCLQREKDGICEICSEMTIPLHSVAPCLCIQMWWDEKNQVPRRLQSCPFRSDVDRFQRNVRENTSVSVAKQKMNQGGTMFSWNVSSPCRLEAEVWLCRMGEGGTECRNVTGFWRRLSKAGWQQDRHGFWVNKGVFEDIPHPLPLCVQVKVDEMENILGPFCPSNYHRGHWSSLILVSVLLISLTLLGFCLVHGKVKRWAWELHQKGRAVSGEYVLLLSPPDVDGPLAEQLSRLASHLLALGFQVSLDLWSRAEISSLGPLLWLHSRLHLLRSHGGKVVLFLPTEAWGRPDEGLSSPYSGVFGAALACIQADFQQGHAGKRFVLARFGPPLTPSPGGDQELPELFRGLHVFTLPSESQGFLSELAGRKRCVGVGGHWAGACVRLPRRWHRSWRGESGGGCPIGVNSSRRRSLSKLDNCPVEGKLVTCI